jgi:hypothetical protein
VISLQFNFRSYNYCVLTDQKLEFLFPIEMAQQHGSSLILYKAHWTHQKKCGRPLGDLSNVVGIKISDDETTAAAFEYWGGNEHPTTEN